MATYPRTLAQAATTDLTDTYAAKAALWADATDYIVGELVIDSGTLYQCTTAHTSSGSFADGNFTAVGGSGGAALVEHGDLGVAEEFDLADGNVHTGTLTADCLVTLPVSAGQMLLLITQNATGGWAMTWPSAVRWVGGAPTISTTANGTVAIVITSDGTNLYGDYRGLASELFESPLSITWHTGFWASDPNWAAPADLAAVSSVRNFGTSGATLAVNGSPTMRTAAASLGSKPAIRFTSGAYLATGNFTEITGPTEVCIVFAAAGGITTQQTLFSGNDASRRRTTSTYDTGAYSLQQGGTKITGGTSNQTLHYVRAVFDATDELWLDGTLIASGDAGSEALDGFVVGANSTFSLLLDGLVGFAALKDGLLTTQQRTNMLAWSRSYYGTP